MEGSKISKGEEIVTDKHALGSQVKDPIDNAYSVEKGPPVVVIAEDWVQCDKCQNWRLLPHDINPADLPIKWLCNMLTWLPGMNKCNFSEAETTDALRALYQPPPA